MKHREVFEGATSLEIFNNMPPEMLDIACAFLAALIDCGIGPYKATALAATGMTNLIRETARVAEGSEQSHTKYYNKSNQQNPITKYDYFRSYAMHLAQPCNCPGCTLHKATTAKMMEMLENVDEAYRRGEDCPDQSSG